MKDSILGCWVAHGEGKFINVDKNQICIVYSDYSEIETQHYPENPNGSEYGCAALFRKKGNILAMMPHPERTFLYYQIPNKNDTINNFDSTYGPWFKLFTNLRN
jgi:phosphoribosylformylglycinamidine synthase